MYSVIRDCQFFAKQRLILTDDVYKGTSALVCNERRKRCLNKVLEMMLWN